MGSFKKHDFSYTDVKPFQPGQSVFFTIPLGKALLYSKIILEGTITVTDPGAGNAGVAISPLENPATLLRKFIVDCVKADNSSYPDGTLKNINATSVWFRRQTDYGQYKNSNASVPGQVNGGVIPGAAGVYTVHAEFLLPFALNPNKREIDTALPLDQYKSVTFEVQCGDQSTMYTGNTMTWNFSGLNVRYEDQREDMAGDFYVLFENDIFIPITGANPEMGIDSLPVGYNYLDALMLCRSGANKALTRSIINKIKILRGGDLWYQRKELSAHEDNYTVGGVKVGENTDGLYFIPYGGGDGLLNGAMPVGVAQDMAFLLDVNNPNAGDAVVVSLRRVANPAQFIPAKR